MSPSRQRVVEDVAEQERRDHAEQRPRRRSGEHGAEPQPVGPEERDDAAQVRLAHGGVGRALDGLAPLEAAATAVRALSSPHRQKVAPRPGAAPDADTIAPVQNYVLSELDSGERVISERVRASARSRSASGSAPARATRRDAKAGVSHFIEHLLFKGSRAYTAQQIAEIFDGLGGELNAATSREHTMVYARVPDAHVETALDVMTDMVFAPRFAELDAEREVVLEEIAMYEDTPQELVHDLFSEAVFGAHPLGRPVIGTARRDLVGHAARARRATTGRCTPAATSSSPPPATSSTTGSSRCSSARRRAAAAADGEPRVRAAARGARRRRASASSARTPSSTTSASARPASRAPTGAASPPRSSTRSSAARRRRGSSRRSARSAGWRTPSTRFASQYTDTGLVGIYVGTREENLAAVPRDRRRADRRHRGRATSAPSELERAKENLKGRIMLSMESTSNRMSRLGKSLITDTELLSLRADHRGDRRGRGRRRSPSSPALLLAPERLSVAGHRAGRGARSRARSSAINPPRSRAPRA